MKAVERWDECISITSDFSKVSGIQIKKAVENAFSFSNNEYGTATSTNLPVQIVSDWTTKICTSTCTTVVLCNKET